MSAENAFYKTLGYELMKELAATCVGAKLIPGGAPDAYETILLANGMEVRFTPWRGGGGPFYIILFKGSRYVFELDLSMVVHQYERFTWHLKVPSHKLNPQMLESWLGKPAPFEKDYSAAVKAVKSGIRSGINTPRRGYRFIDGADWPRLCERFLELMRKAIRSHTSDDETGQKFEEAKDDDGKRVTTTRNARRYQSLFRLNLIKLYKGACAISAETIVEVLEAAHIASHSETLENSSRNGLLLRADLHRLFDNNLIAINPESLKVVVSPRLTGSTYQTLSGRTLRARADGSIPAFEHLKSKWEKWTQVNGQI